MDGQYCVGIPLVRRRTGLVDDLVMTGGRGAAPTRMPREAYVLFCGLFLSVASNNLVTPLLPAIRDDLGISLASVGTFVSAYGMARLIVDLPSGALVARVGPRSITVLGVSLNCVASVVAVFDPNFAVLLAARIVAGTGAGFLAAVVLSALSDIVPAEIRGRVLSLYQVANNLGIVRLSAWATSSRVHRPHCCRTWSRARSVLWPWAPIGSSSISVFW